LSSDQPVFESFKLTGFYENVIGGKSPKTIQEMFQLPTRAPISQALTVPEGGAPHSETATMIVMIEPISDASQALNLKTASIMKSAMSGIKDAIIVNTTLPVGFRGWANTQIIFLYKILNINILF
jgi:hypothetical protein